MCVYNNNTYVHVHIYVSIHIYIYVCVYIFVYIHTHVALQVNEIIMIGFFNAQNVYKIAVCSVFLPKCKTKLH